MRESENSEDKKEMIYIRLFATAREKSGSNVVELPVDQQTTVHDLMRMLHEACPELRKIPGRVAVNEEFVENDFRVCLGDEIAFIPPVSGG